VQRDQPDSDVRAGDQMAFIATDGMVLPRTGDTVASSASMSEAFLDRLINLA
jgi:hypothetical protein